MRIEFLLCSHWPMLARHDEELGALNRYRGRCLSGVIGSYWLLLKYNFCREFDMTDAGRVVTAKLPEDVAARMDEIAERIERSKSWIVREAVVQWLDEEQRRYAITMDAIKDVDEGRMIDHDDLKIWAEQSKRDGRTKSAA